MRATVKLDGVHTDGTRRWLPFSVRLYFTAGSEAVRMVHSFIFDGDPAKDFIRSMGVSVKALRVYEAQGLVEPVRTGTGWRAYGPEQVARLHQVLALKRLFPGVENLVLDFALDGELALRASALGGGVPPL